MITAVGVFTLLYLLVIFLLLFGMSNIPKVPVQKLNFNNTFSIVIPFRNEANNLPGLLQSLKSLNYPLEKFEIFLVNDASTDTSEFLCTAFQKAHPSFPIHLLQNISKSKSPKKDAVELAINSATQEFIITTDADCRVPKNWLGLMSTWLDNEQVQVIAGPVTLEATEDWDISLMQFQHLDFLSLQATTMGLFGIGRPFLCNAANFCYSKEAFMKVKGFSGNKDRASGDDVFLLEKFVDHGFKVSFLASPLALVTTQPVRSLSSLFSQRIRWASKTSAFKNKTALSIGLSVFIMNLGLAATILAGILRLVPLESVGIILAVKILADFLLISRCARFYGRDFKIGSFLFSSIIYPFFSSTVVIVSLFSSYHWKGRKFTR